MWRGGKHVKWWLQPGLWLRPSKLFRPFLARRQQWCMRQVTGVRERSQPSQYRKGSSMAGPTLLKRRQPVRQHIENAGNS